MTAQAVEQWRSVEMAEGRLPRRTAAKVVAILHGIFERARKAYGLTSNPIDDVETHPPRYDASRFDFYSPEEVKALVRAAASEQDAALFLTAAFTGARRGELLALRWRDVDFAGETVRIVGSFDHRAEEVGTPKSGKGRSVPMVEEVARALARLGQRPGFTGEDDLVFPGEDGGYLDGSALRRRYLEARRQAKLRPIRFHDLRHTFGSLAIRKASLVDVQTWMGHADVKTTMRYLHHRPRGDEARLLGAAFRLEEPASELQANGFHEPAEAFHGEAAAEVESPAQPALSRNGEEPPGSP